LTEAGLWPHFGWSDVFPASQPFPRSASLLFSFCNLLLFNSLRYLRLEMLAPGIRLPPSPPYKRGIFSLLLLTYSLLYRFTSHRRTSKPGRTESMTTNSESHLDLCPPPCPRPTKKSSVGTKTLTRIPFIDRLPSSLETLLGSNLSPKARILRSLPELTYPPVDPSGLNALSPSPEPDILRGSLFPLFSPLSRPADKCGSAAKAGHIVLDSNSFLLI